MVKLLKTVLRILSAPFRWLIKAPLRFIVGLICILGILALLLPNVVALWWQGNHIKSIDEASAWVFQDDEANVLGAGFAPEAGNGPVDCIVVLGASVNPDGTPSTILADRIQVGVDLYNAGLAPKILMSGDNQSDRQTYDEVANMKRYAVDILGVPSEDVFCDHAGINTYDSMYRAYYVFGARRVIVVSQAYHLPRALMDAASFRMEALGVPADLHTYENQTFYNVREVAARVSDAYKVLTNADAHYLSEPVSLEQSGDVTSWQYE